MNHEETYLVEIRRADGVCDIARYDDVLSATAAFTDASDGCRPGERVKLVRCNSVTLASRARA